MLLVLVIWNRAHQLPVALQPSNQTTQKTVISTTPTPSLPAIDQPVIEIQAVIVPGDLDAERVRIRSISSTAFVITGWTLENGKGQEYTFPSLTLYPGGAIDLYSKNGANTANEIYWGLSQPAWQSGAKVTISDYAGNMRTEYTIP